MLTNIIVFESCALRFHLNSEYYIFKDLNELEIVENDFQNYGTVDKYDNPSKDKYLNELNYEDFYAAYYECEDFEFEIYAYEFCDEAVSKNYYRNVTGTESKSDVNFKASSGISETKMIVIDCKNAYSITFENKYGKKIQAFLSENFTLHLVYDETCGWITESNA